MRNLQNTIDQWKAGFGIFLRLALLSIVVNLVCLPIRAVGLFVDRDSTSASVIAGIYLVLVIPLVLPEIIRICGFRKIRVDEIDGTGDMNEASKRKMRELEAEKNARIRLGEQAVDGNPH